MPVSANRLRASSSTTSTVRPASVSSACCARRAAHAPRAAPAAGRRPAGRRSGAGRCARAARPGWTAAPAAGRRRGPAGSAPAAGPARRLLWARTGTPRRRGVAVHARRGSRSAPRRACRGPGRCSGTARRPARRPPPARPTAVTISTARAVGQVAGSARSVTALSATRDSSPRGRSSIDQQPARPLRRRRP